MKITEQRLREIITEELMNENFFKKLFGMGDKSAEVAYGAMEQLWDAFNKNGFQFDGTVRTALDQHGRRDWVRNPKIYKRDMQDFLEDHKFSEKKAAVEAALKVTHSKVQKTRLNSALTHYVANIEDTMNRAGLEIGWWKKDMARKEKEAKDAAEEAFRQRQIDNWAAGEKAQRDRVNRERDGGRPRYHDGDVHGYGNVASIASLEETKKK